MVGNVTIQGQIVGTATFDGAKISAVVTVFPPINATVVFGKSGVTIHNELTDRDAEDSHPIEAISSPINDSSNVYGWIRSTLLTGLSAFTDVAIVATDSILSAFAKLQGQVNAIKGRLGLLENRVIADITLSIQSHVVDINSLDINEGEKISISITGKGYPSTSIMIRINDLQSGYYSGASAATYITCFAGNNFFINLINLSLNNAMLIAEVFFARSNGSVTTSGITVFGTNPSIIERITKISIIGYSSYNLPVGTRIIIKKL